MVLNRKLILIVNVDWFFLSHRLPLALEALERNWKVYIITKNTGRFKEIEALGLIPINLQVERSGKNVFKEALVIRNLHKLYLEIKPDAVHHVTLKIAIYGSIAARLANVPRVINAISGLGFNFTDGRKSLIQKIIQKLMIKAFKNRGHIFIFQNPDDSMMFEELGLSEGNKAVIIKGSGVDLNTFTFSETPNSGKIRFLLPARMLKDKGVEEFIAAAKLLDAALPNKGEWILAGGLDANNPAGYNENELTSLIAESNVKWAGFQKDMISTLRDSDVVVLPSYREGLPKSLIEAAAIGRPIVTTDAVGCRECVMDGVNGYLVPIKDIDGLAAAMEKLLLNPELRKQMGIESRIIAEREFSIEHVVEKTLALYE